MSDDKLHGIPAMADDWPTTRHDYLGQPRTGKIPEKVFVGVDWGWSGFDRIKALEHVEDPHSTYWPPMSLEQARALQAYIDKIQPRRVPETLEGRKAEARAAGLVVCDCVWIDGRRIIWVPTCEVHGRCVACGRGQYSTLGDDDKKEKDR